MDLIPMIPMVEEDSVLIQMIPMPHKAGIDPNDLNARYDPNDPISMNESGFHLNDPNFNSKPIEATLLQKQNAIQLFLVRLRD